jgi:hypothetical protein
MREKITGNERKSFADDFRHDFTHSERFANKKEEEEIFTF